MPIIKKFGILENRIVDVIFVRSFAINESDISYCLPNYKHRMEKHKGVKRFSLNEYGEEELIIKVITNSEEQDNED